MSVSSIVTGGYLFNQSLIVTAGYVGETADLTPTLTSISPISGARGTTVSVLFTGTHFDRPSLLVTISGTLVTVGPPYSVTSTSFRSDFGINVAAALTARNVTVITDEGTTAAKTFTVTAAGGGGGSNYIGVPIQGHKRRGGG